MRFRVFLRSLQKVLRLSFPYFLFVRKNTFTESYRHLFLLLPYTTTTPIIRQVFLCQFSTLLPPGSRNRKAVFIRLRVQTHTTSPRFRAHLRRNNLPCKDRQSHRIRPGLPRCETKTYRCSRLLPGGRTKTHRCSRLLSRCQTKALRRGRPLPRCQTKALRYSRLRLRCRNKTSRCCRTGHRLCRRYRNIIRCRTETREM